MPNGQNDHAWDYQEELARRTRERKRIVREFCALMREIEWSGEFGDCLLCGHYPPGTHGVDASGLGHAPDCRLGALLEKYDV